MLLKFGGGGSSSYSPMPSQVGIREPLKQRPKTASYIEHGMFGRECTDPTPEQIEDRRRKNCLVKDVVKARMRMECKLQ